MLGCLVLLVWAVISLVKRNGKAKKMFVGSAALFIVMVIGAVNSSSSKQLTPAAPVISPTAVPTPTAEAAATPTVSPTVTPSATPTATPALEPASTAAAEPAKTSAATQAPVPTEAAPVPAAPKQESPKEAIKPAATAAPKQATAKPAPTPKPEPKNANVSYKNCTEAKAAGAAPLYEGDPGYSTKLDRDRDGVACEK
ncbi:excalibur calcium-binding domain-containing protein [Paenibacillus lutrae]|uniref:excalibur calcium-binding domain-containing protein n=1 Tax=Paenibacillus lutrae TaxID=2078573 RepID=UPI001912065B|nr:excalibur calcium-binding domain-containing protein [Paenibacillus lutrae]